MFAIGSSTIIRRDIRGLRARGRVAGAREIRRNGEIRRITLEEEWQSDTTSISTGGDPSVLPDARNRVKFPFYLVFPRRRIRASSTGLSSKMRQRKKKMTRVGREGRREKTKFSISFATFVYLPCANKPLCCLRSSAAFPPSFSDQLLLYSTPFYFISAFTPSEFR